MDETFFSFVKVAPSSEYYHIRKGDVSESLIIYS